MGAITNFAYKGRGRLWVGDASTEALREWGNVSSATLGFDIEEQTLKDYRTCAGGNYASSIDINQATLSIVGNTASPENFADAFYATTSLVAEAAATEETMVVPSITNLLLMSANTIKESGTITVSSATGGGGTVYTGGGDDYTVFSGGIQFHLGGTGSLAGGETVYVNYTKRAVTQIETIMTASLTRFLMITGLNCAQSGAPNIHRIWSFKPGPTEGWEVISDEFGSFSVTGKIDADTSKSASVSQYMQTDMATTTD